MNPEASQKVSARHLARKAYLYVRQSTLRQVMENTESTQRQYALRQRAIALGWPADQVITIDTDLGQSGASAADREGFQRLVTEVGLGRAGIVMGLEVSRLARNSSDWHRLLEICALTDTLILDEDGIYDPAHFNDRLLLGLKGTMSEAELHLLRARLRGGILNKARRGELESPLPIGFVYDASARVILDPDLQIQQAVRTLFQTFRRTGSAAATVKYFRKEGLRFPRRVKTEPSRGEVVWADVEHSSVLRILHNPRYAGAFFYGRTRSQKVPGPGEHYRILPREDWTALLPGAHAGYISWQEFEDNQRRLRENACARGTERRHGPPREGPALLQGLVICGRCGERMTVRYVWRTGGLVPYYVCQREGIQKAQPICQCISGASLDRAVGKLLLEVVTPMALEVALAVQEEIRTRALEADSLRRKQTERARYEAELARRRYMRVDPENRLVADALEADWNARLRAQREAEEEYQRQREADQGVLDEQQRKRIAALATDVPQLWNDPKVPDRERKRIVRLLLEDVTLKKGQELTAHLRFRGGATRTLMIPLPLPAWALRQTSPTVVSEVDRLLDNHTDAEIASILTQRGLRSNAGKPINALMIWRVRHHYGLKDRYRRLREQGLLTLSEIARRLAVHTETIKVWRRMALIRACAYNDKGQYLYAPPGPDTPAPYKWKGISAKKRLRRLAAHTTDEAQYEA
jgi:DNA invertase Pin-like site-specific DNA recombinase